MSDSIDLDILSRVYGGFVEVDFGTLPIYEKQFTVANKNVTSTSSITASLMYEAPTSKDLDEIGMDSLSIVCGQVSLGTFTMIIRAVDGCYLADKFKINYLITT